MAKKLKKKVSKALQKQLQEHYNSIMYDLHRDLLLYGSAAIEIPTNAPAVIRRPDEYNVSDVGWVTTTTPPAFMNELYSAGEFGRIWGASFVESRALEAHLDYEKIIKKILDDQGVDISPKKTLSSIIRKRMLKKKRRT